jgi:hypothetical protein
MRPWWLGFALLLACRPLVAADITVVVPDAVRAGYTREASGRVVVYLQHPDLERHVALGLLCDPEPGEIRFEYRAVAVGCPEVGVVEAWIEPWGVADETVRCGRADAFLDPLEAPRPTQAPYDRGSVFGGGDCRATTAAVRLDLDSVLDLPPEDTGA